MPKWTNQEIREQALLWLEEIEKMRKKSSNLYGPYSGAIKTRVRFAKSVVDTLVKRASDQGKVVYNRTRNDELEREVKTLERNVGKLKQEF